MEPMSGGELKSLTSCVTLITLGLFSHLKNETKNISHLQFSGEN